LESRRDEDKRFVFKQELIIRQLLKKGYDRATIIQIFRFLDGVLSLSDEMQEQLIYEEFHQEEVEKMTYITSWERIAMRKGMERGMLEGVSEMVLETLKERFGEVPEDVQKVIITIENKDELKKLFTQAMRVSTLNEFQLALR